MESMAWAMSSALRLSVGTAMIATLLNPWAARGGLLAAAAQLPLCLLVALGVGTVESLVARLKLRVVPSYIGVAFAAGAVALLLGAWGAPGNP